MSEKRDNALIEREMIVNQYLRGLYDGKTIAKEYSKSIQEIKRLYASVLSYYAKKNIDVSFDEEKGRFKVTIIGIIGWMILYLLLPNNGFVFFLRTVGMIALTIALYCNSRKNTIWTVTPLILYFICVFFRLMGGPSYDKSSYVVVIVLIAFAFDTLKCYFHKQEIINRGENDSKKLSVVQERLIQLIPKIKNELMELQEEWYQKYSEIVLPEDKKDYISAEKNDFPPAFWWQVNVNNLKEFATQIFSEKKYDVWETRLVRREQGNEFQATDEYSPLFAPILADNETIMRSFRENMGCEIYDAISQYVTLSGAREKTIQYETFKHGEMERISAELSVFGLAREIDKSYERGELLTDDYKRLSNDMFRLGSLANDYVNEKETQEYITYTPIRSHTNIWTGQFMIAGWRDNKNVLHYAIRQYYCQLPHLIKNIKALEGIKFDVIDYDPFACNPYFLACFYAKFPTCL